MVGLITLLDRLAWQDSANCNGTDPEEFFSDPEKKMYSNPGMLTKICNSCVVFNECKEYAVKYDMSGWWANTTENSRKKEQRKRNIVPLSIVRESK